jgi:asparagine synthase (glutamine-hydrolysing)
MPAICGFFGSPRFELPAEAIFSHMLEAVAERGRGAPAVLLDREVGVALGVRPRRQDGRAAVHTSEDGALSMVCDGRVFNHAEVTSWLRSKGHAPRSEDTGELLLHLFEEEGEAGLRRADGQFAFALWDRPRRRLVLARDFLGVHPLYYTSSRGHVAFASEIRGLLAHPGVGAAVDPVAVAQYLTFLGVPGPRTLFAGVCRLPPGHVAVIEAGGDVTLVRYWDLLDDPIPERADEAFYVERVRELHREAVARRAADGPIAALLSGGNDSSANVALLARTVKGPLHTFTVGLRDVEGRPAYTDLEYARRVAAHVGSVHHEALLSTSEFLSAIGATVEALDDLVSEPSSVFLDHALRRVKEQGLEVVVTGEANDELSAGHREMLAIRDGYYRRWLPYMRLPRGVRRAVARLAPLVSPGRLDILERAARDQEYFWNFEIAWPESEIDEILSSTADARTAGERASDVVGRVASRLRASEHGRRDYLGHVVYVMMQDHYLGNLMLGKLDRLAARLGLEVLCPYAEPRYAHFVFNVPAAIKTANGIVKHVFKRAIEDLLPPEVVYRPKQGFRTPVVELFQGPLGAWARPHLYEEGLTREGVLRRATIERLLDEHRAGRRDHSTKLWTVLVLNLWHERWIKSGSPARS